MAKKVKNLQLGDSVALSTDLTGKADKKVPAAAGNVATLDANGNLADGGVLASSLVLSSDLATVATSGSYDDLSGKPTLATVATSGSYDDLSDKPTIPGGSSTTPKMDGTAKVGTETSWAHGDHVHPSDTNKADKKVPAATGNIATLDATGNLADGGKKVADLQTKITANGILKANGSGTVSAAVAGTDYQAPLVAGTDYQTPLVAGTDYQTPLTFDTTPTTGSSNPVTSGGIKSAIDAKVGSVSAGSGISVSGTTSPTVSVKLSSKTGNGLSVVSESGKEGLFVDAESLGLSTAYIPKGSITVTAANSGDTTTTPATTWKEGWVYNVADDGTIVNGMNAAGTGGASMTVKAGDNIVRVKDSGSKYRWDKLSATITVPVTSVAGSGCITVTPNSGTYTVGLNSGNGLHVDAGASYGELELRILGSNGITVDTDGVSVKASSGITVDTNGVSIKKPTNSGLNVDSNGVAVGMGNGISVTGSTVAVKPYNGITVSSSGVAVKASSGITVDTNGVSIKTPTNSGLVVDSNGIAVGGSDAIDVSGSSISVRCWKGLQVKAPSIPGCSDAGLAVLLDDNSGLGFNSSGGLGIGTGTDSGINVSGSSVAIKIKGCSGIGVDSDGIYVVGGPGIAVGAGGVSVKVAGCNGIGVDSGGIYVVNGSGIAVGAGGVSVTGSSGITVDGSGVSVKGSSGITVDSNGVSIKKPTNSGLLLNSSGVAVGAGNGINVTGSTVAVKAADGGGLSVDSDGVAIDLATNSGLEVLASSVDEGLRVGAGNGISVLGSSVAVAASDTGGLSVDVSGVGIKLKGCSGLSVGASGVGVELKGSGGLSVDASGVGIKIKDCSGLSVNSDGVGLDVGEGLALGASGVYIKRNDTDSGKKSVSTNGNGVYVDLCRAVSGCSSSALPDTTTIGDIIMALGGSTVA